MIIPRFTTKYIKKLLELQIFLKFQEPFYVWTLSCSRMNLYFIVVGQTLLSSQGTNSTSYVYSHLCFLDKKVNKIQILLQGEKSHKFKVSRYAVKQKRPWRTVFLQFSKVDFYVWTNLGLVGDFTSFEAISRSPLTNMLIMHSSQR